MNRIHSMSAGATIATLALATALFSASAHAEGVPAAVAPAVAAKLAWRGDAPDVGVPEMRIARRGGFLSVQSDLRNGGDKDHTLYYRYRWLDQAGNQVGNGDAWKQLGLLSKTQHTLKGTAPHASVTDFRLELSFESQ